jgi:WD40 repeat protein
MADKASVQKIKVFISYSRSDLAFADKLEAALKDCGVEPLIDRTEIYAFEDWWKRIQALITQCDTVVFVLSPEAVRSPVCRKEVTFAASLNKRIAPIVFRRADNESIPEELARLNFIFFDDETRFPDSLNRLAEALQTDIDWLRKHTDFGHRALGWEMAKRSSGLLLRSPLLEEAERWIASRPTTAPAPTGETQAYIAESRRASTRRRNVLTGSLVAGLVVSLGLAGLAYWQREVAQSNEARAVENERVANARRLENLRSESQRTAVAAQQLVNEGNPAVAKAIALEGLPGPSAPDRPLVNESLQALHRAARADFTLTELTVPGENILSGAFTPNGKYLLTGTNAGSLVIWDLSTYTKRHHIKGEDNTITQIDVSPDGRLALVAGLKKPAVYDIESGKPVIDLPRWEKTFARTGRFSPTGKEFALGFQDNHAEIRNVATGAVEHDLSGPTDYEAAVKRQVTSIWGDRGTDPIVEAVEKANWQIWGGMTDVIFSPDGSLLATAGMGDAEGAARLFSVADGSLVATLWGESLANNYNNQRIAFSPDGKYFAVAARDHKVRVWKVPGGELAHTLLHFVDAQCLTFDPSGAVLVAGYDDGSVRVWSTADGALLAVIGAHAQGIQSVAFSPDGRLLATASDDSTIRLWWNTLNADDCKVEDRQRCDVSMRKAATFRGHGDIVQQVLFSPDGSMLASVSRDESVRLWRTHDPGWKVLESGSREEDDRTQVLSFVDPREVLKFSGDGKQLLAYNHFQGMTIWDAQLGTVLCRMEGERVSRRASDGNLQVHLNPSEVRLADCAPGALVAEERFRYSSYSDNYWRLSPDGMRAIIRQHKSSDAEYYNPDAKDVRQLVDTASGATLANLTYNDRSPVEYYFSADSSIVVGALAGAQKTDDHPEILDRGEFAIWNARTGKVLGSSGLWQSSFDLVDISKTGTTFVLGKDRTSLVVAVTVEGGKVPQWRKMQAQNRPVSAVAICGRGDQIAAAFKESIDLFDPKDGRRIATMFAGEQPMKKLLFSDDCSLIAGWDEGRTLWLWNVESRTALASIPQKQLPVAIQFSPAGDRLAVQADDGSTFLLETGLEWLGLDKQEDLIDWTRGSLSLSLSPSDRQRFLLREASASESDRRLQDIQPLRVPKPVLQEGRPDALKSCDALAANPTDRFRQSEGVVFEKIDVARALEACETAVMMYPTDWAVRYQRGRVHERAGRIKEALDDYRAAAQEGLAVALRRIGQVIELKIVGPDQDLGSVDTWMDRGAEAGDVFALMHVATRVARSQGVAGAAVALRTASAAYDGNIADASAQLALDIEKLATSPAERETAYFYLQLSQRIAQGTPTEQLDATSRNAVADRLRTVPRQLSPSALVRLYRESRDWIPQ